MTAARRLYAAPPALLAVTPLLVCLASSAAAAPELHVAPEEVAVTMLYHGTTVEVDATLPVGRDAALVCRGPVTETTLKLKGKVWNVLWASRGEVGISGLPAFYAVFTSAPLAKLADPAELERLGVGLGAVEAAARMTPQSVDRHAVFAELVKLRESERLFSVGEGELLIEPDGDGDARLSSRLFLPPKAPTGTYEIGLFAFADGHGKRVASSALRVRQVGLAARITALADHRGALYGVLAVLIAIVAGLLTGMLFGLGSGRGH